MTTKQLQTKCIKLKVHRFLTMYSLGHAEGGKNGLASTIHAIMCELLHGVYLVHSVHDCIIVHSTSTIKDIVTRV